MTLSKFKKITEIQKKFLSKPHWIRIKLPKDFSRIYAIKSVMRKNNLYSICEEASCPNLTDCFSRGTAAFMILGKVCTRHCPFCNVVSGRPSALDVNEPHKLAKIISDMKLSHVVITSVNRDDLHDGGAKHFSDCISVLRQKSSKTKIEILVPDFRGRMNRALEIFSITPPDIFNHNLESIPRLYNQIRPGANYKWSLKLLERFKIIHPEIPTKSGLMVGLGETYSEIVKVMHDLHDHGVSMLTLGQYLQPSHQHLSVYRYFSLNEFNEMKKEALKIGFTYVASGPLVRSSYQADLQAKGQEVN